MADSPAMQEKARQTDATHDCSVADATSRATPDSHSSYNGSVDPKDKSTQQLSYGSSPLVTVILPTFNSGQTIERCLESIRSQSYGHIQVIVVDGGSKDDTQLIAEKWADIVLVGNYNSSQARAAGLERAGGDFVLAVDSDMYLPTQTLELCVRACQDGADAVILPEWSVGGNFFGRCFSFGKNLTQNRVEGNEMLIPRFYRRADLVEVGGWDSELFAGEDADLYLRVQNSKGARIPTVTAPFRVVHEEGNISLSGHYRKFSSLHYGGTYPKFEERHQGYLRQLQVKRARQYVGAWKELLRHPVLVSGMMLLLLVRSIGFNIARLSHKSER